MKTHPVAISATRTVATHNVVLALALTGERVALQVTLMHALNVAITFFTSNDRVVAVRISHTLIATSTCSRKD